MLRYNDGRLAITERKPATRARVDDESSVRSDNTDCNGFPERLDAAR
jgi:hypothetical protein